MACTLAEIDLQIAQLKARKQRVQAKQAQENRRKEDKQKYIIGAWVMKNDLALVEKIKAGLTREQDKAAFDLSTLPAHSQADN